MANAFRFGIYDEDGAPVTGAAAGCVVSAWNARTLASRTPPAVTEPLPYVYSVTPTDDDEVVGTLIVVDSGSGTSQRYKALLSYRQASQFLAWTMTDATGDLWAGAAPTLEWSSPSVPAITSPSTGVYVAVPSSADIAVGAYGRVVAAADCYPTHITVAADKPVSLAAPVVSGGLRPEQLAVSALREWLVFQLPARCAAINATRPAKLISSSAGPFTLDGGLLLSDEGLTDTAPVEVDFAAGTYSSQQVADAINAEIPDFAASVDSWGRLVITSDPPAGTLPSVMCALPSSLNAAFGWGANGEVVTREALVAPSWRGVMDGIPLPSQELGAGFWVILGDRSAAIVTGNRRSEYLVTVSVDVMRSLGLNQQPFRDREAIAACVRAVREVLTDDAAGRQLGRAEFGDVVFTETPRTAIMGQALQAPASRGSFFFDVAALEVSVRINNPATGP